MPPASLWVRRDKALFASEAMPAAPVRPMMAPEDWPNEDALYVVRA